VTQDKGVGTLWLGTMMVQAKSKTDFKPGLRKHHLTKKPLFSRSRDYQNITFPTVPS